ncbi:hypothetical protein [Nocardia miyunensis]|uniref:hypothetical protein n=1 Tax=Nocardia miyunensis TaxID=282684 RepID=UPI0008333442|nr:hypothetical protein [Nocardia miyunensis]
MDEVHHTEADGLEATWRPTHLDDKKIEIVQVHNISGGVGPDVMFAPGTDLVAARERFPALGPLWDKVRAEFWAWLSPAPHISVSIRGTGRRWD